VDEYYQFLAAYPDQPWDKRLGNPVHHVHAGKVPEARMPISFALLLNIASLPGMGDRETIWSFLRRYDPALTPEASPELDRLVSYAVEYGSRFIAPALRRRAPTAEEVPALRELDELLARTTAPAAATRIRRLSCRTTSTRSARNITARSACATGSRRFTRLCSGASRARAWAASSPSTESKTAAA
jgi:lysyl-tRNA synthetase class 1